MSISAAYTLRDRGTELRVETWVAPGEKKPNRARLLVDGTEVESGVADEVGHLDLGQQAGHPTRVVWWWTGRVAGCALVEPGRGDVRRRSVPYAPPAGTRAARVHAWGVAHPGLYASRHVVLQVVGTAVAIPGVSVIVRAFVSRLLPRIDFSWLPDFHPPAWLEYVDPTYYLAPLFRWVPPLLDRLLVWIPDVDLGWAKYVVGLLIAITVAVRETRRRKRISEAPAEREDAP
jgi:hypothetical protein